MDQIKADFEQHAFQTHMMQSKCNDYRHGFHTQWTTTRDTERSFATTCLSGNFQRSRIPSASSSPTQSGRLRLLALLANSNAVGYQVRAFRQHSAGVCDYLFCCKEVVFSCFNQPQLASASPIRQPLICRPPAVQPPSFELLMSCMSLGLYNYLHHYLA